VVGGPNERGFPFLKSVEEVDHRKDGKMVFSQEGKGAGARNMKKSRNKGKEWAGEKSKKDIRGE